MSDMRCGHCGREGFLEQLDDLKLPGRDAKVQRTSVQGDAEQQVRLVVMRCTRCEEVTLLRYTPEGGSSNGGAVGDFERIFPQSHAVDDLPERVRGRYGKMLELAYEPDAFAMRAGKVLEAICNEQGYAKGSLGQRLDRLIADDRLPPGLGDQAHLVREYRNIGSHDDGTVDVEGEDVPLIRDFVESLLEYLYWGPAKLQRVKAAIERRQSAVVRERRWTREELLSQIEERHGSAEKAAARRLFAWVDARGDLVEWYGAGKKDGSFQAGYRDERRYLFPFALYGYGRIEIHFQYIKRQPSFADEQPRREFLERLNMIPGVSIGDEMLSKRPSIPLQVLTDPAAFERLMATLDWAFERASGAY